MISFMFFTSVFKDHKARRRNTNTPGLAIHGFHADTVLAGFRQLQLPGFFQGKGNGGIRASVHDIPVFHAAGISLIVEDGYEPPSFVIFRKQPVESIYPAGKRLFQLVQLGLHCIKVPAFQDPEAAAMLCSKVTIRGGIDEAVVFFKDGIRHILIENIKEVAKPGVGQSVALIAVNLTAAVIDPLQHILNMTVACLLIWVQGTSNIDIPLGLIKVRCMRLHDLYAGIVPGQNDGKGDLRLNTPEFLGEINEILLGKALGADRSRAVIASKVNKEHLRRGDLITACENSLRRLGTDYIDLYQIHWPDWEVPLEETIGALLQLKDQGKIRAIGVSNFGVRDLSDVLPFGCVVSDQLAYSLLFRGIEYSLKPKCVESGVGILTYSSLAQGLLSGKYATADDFPVGRARTKLFATGKRAGVRHGGPGFEEGTFAAIDKIRNICRDIGQEMADVALAWSLAQPGITSVLAGGRTPAQVLTNAKGASLTLSQEVLDALSAATEPVKAFIGDDPDPWSYGRIR